MPIYLSNGADPVSDVHNERKSLQVQGKDLKYCLKITLDFIQVYVRSLRMIPAPAALV